MILHSFQVSACWTKWNWWTTCETPIYRTFLSTIESSWINSSLQFYVFYRFVSRRKQDYDVSESMFIPEMIYRILRWFNGPVIAFSVSVDVEKQNWIIQDIFLLDSIFFETLGLQPMSSEKEEPRTRSRSFYSRSSPQTRRNTTLSHSGYRLLLMRDNHHSVSKQFRV